MTGLLDTNPRFTASLRARDRLVGSFVKTPHPAVVEVMALAAFDFLVLDAEHGGFDRASVDMCILAGLAWRIPVLVRIPVAEPDWIMFCLDCGAAGLFVPHVSSVEEAQRISRLVRYGAGGDRGFSPSVRAGSYGRRGLAAHLHGARQDFALVCQIEDPKGVACAGDIAAVDGVDAVFIGPADLAVAAGLDDMEHPDAVELCRLGIAAASAIVPSAIYVSDMAAAGRWQDAGASFFLVGSDHTMIAAGSAARLAGAAGTGFAKGARQ